MVTKICNFLSSGILVVLLLLALALAGPYAFGCKSFAVLSGSMVPTIGVGCMVYVKTGVSPESIKAGDVITFQLPEGSMVATHRVMENMESTREFLTKGDANEDADSPIAYDRLVGRVMFHLPFLGYLSNTIKSKEGILLGAGLLIVMVILSFIPAILKKEDAQPHAPPPKRRTVPSKTKVPQRGK